MASPCRVLNGKSQLDVWKDNRNIPEAASRLVLEHLLVGPKAHVVSDAQGYRGRLCRVDGVQIAIPVAIELVVAQRSRGVQMWIPSPPNRTNTPGHCHWPPSSRPGMIGPSFENDFQPATHCPVETVVPHLQHPYNLIDGGNNGTMTEPARPTVGHPVPQKSFIATPSRQQASRDTSNDLLQGRN